MKLLLDENLSRRLVPALQQAFPGTQHLQDLGLQGEVDLVVWAFARREGYALVSKDDDFRQIGLLRGAPPKVLVLAIGNGANAVALRVLIDNQARIEAFDASPQESVLMLRAA